MAVSGWLAQELAQSPETGLLAPTVVIANFGTAGAYHGDWSVGQTLLAYRLRNGLEGESLFPERLTRWDGDETECRTVGAPMREVHPGESVRPLYDMEAFGVAQAVTSYLSSSHLVVGKCVLDTIGPKGDQHLDYRALRQRCESDYREGALRFLEHALEQQALLDQDQRRQRAVEITELAHHLSAEVQQTLRLTVSQHRDLLQRLKGRLSAEPELESFMQLWEKRPAFSAGQGKQQRQNALREFLNWLQGEPSRTAPNTGTQE